MAIPRIKFALNGWESPITLIKITSSIVDYEKLEIRENIDFTGMVQPLSPETLKLKPLESRSWEWLMIHTKEILELNTNDLVGYLGKNYKVMLKKNYYVNGYFEYHLVEDYE